MISAALRRAGQLVGLLIVESMLIFSMGQLLPGDAATSILGVNATPEAVSALREQLGLNETVVIRYLHWIRGVICGDFGTSVSSNLPVTEVLREPLSNSVSLVALAGVATAAIAVTLGVAAGTRPGGRLDSLITGSSIAVLSVPPFVTAAAAGLVFASLLRWLPPASLVPLGGTPWDRPEVLILPVATLVLIGSAWASRLIRGAVADANVRPNVEAARLAGLPSSRVTLVHLLPQVIGPCAQTLGWLAVMLTGATVVVERVFAFPGIGQTLISAAQAHDAPLLQAVALIMVAIGSLAFVVADIVTALPHSGRSLR